MMGPQFAKGTLLTSNAAGFGYEGAPGAGQQFGHPWKPFLSARTLQLSRGLVETFTPKIGEKRMDETVLELKADVANELGESWAVLEVEPDAQGKLTKDSRIEIVHTKETVSLEEKIGRAPLTLILWRDQRPFRAIPVVHFNLKYHRVIPAPGGGPVRHLFA